MVLFKWNDSYSVGIKEIDEQHKKLVEILNRLYDAMQQGKANDVLGIVLAELIKYTKIHFAAEERLMQAHGYADFINHKREHDALTTKAASLQNEFKTGKTCLSLSVSNFLKDWLSHHILDVDKKYAPYLNSKGVK